MTLLEAASAIGAGVVATLGAGGLPKVVGAIARWRRGKAEAEAEIAKEEAVTYRDVATAKAEVAKADANVVGRALSLVDDAREDTQRHVTELVQCERRCARLEAAADARNARIASLEAAVERLVAKNGTLESENVELRARVTDLEERVRDLLPEALGNYAATIDAPNVTPIGRLRKDI